MRSLLAVLIIGLTLGVTQVATAISQKTLSSQRCLDIARSGMIAGNQEVMCGFKGSLNEKLKRIYTYFGCGNLVARDDLDEAAEAVLEAMRNEYSQMGKESFCQDAREYYDGQLITLNSATQSPPTPSQALSSLRSVAMQRQGGVYVVPVVINNAITLGFVVDSGAADVSIPADVVLILMRTGTIQQTDFLGKQTYRLADGSTVPSQTFRIRSLKVGDIVLENVTGSVADVRGSLLLGQSFLGRFKSWAIDNSTHSLVLQ